MSQSDLVKFYEREFGPFIHMAPNDKAIWLRFLMFGGSRYAPFQYDVRVGDGVQMPAGTTQIGIKAAYALTTKRIDVLAIGVNAHYIFEVKQRAGLSAVGQLIGYESLYRQRVGQDLTIRKILVTNELQPDMINMLVESEITYYEVGY